MGTRSVQVQRLFGVVRLFIVVGLFIVVIVVGLFIVIVVVIVVGIFIVVRFCIVVLLVPCSIEEALKTKKIFTVTISTTYLNTLCIFRN